MIIVNDLYFTTAFYILLLIAGFISTRGILSDERSKNILKKIKPRGWKLIAVYISIILVTQLQTLNRKNIDENSADILAEEKRKRDSLIDIEANNRHSELFNSISTAFANQGIKIKSLEDFIADKEGRERESDFISKQADVIIDLLRETKKVYFRILTDNSNMLFSGEHPNDWALSAYDDEEKNQKILFHQDDAFIASKPFYKFYNDPLLPSKIKDKLKFKLFERFVSKTNREDYKVKISFYNNYATRPDDEWLIVEENDCTLEEYVKKHDILIKEIDSWLNIHYETQGRLNYHGVIDPS